MADPVSWKVVERGWRVVNASGERIGRVRELTGDEDHDIFDGLTVGTGILSRQKYVASEHVVEIREGIVVIDLSRSAVEALQRYKEPPPEERVLPESSTWYQRLAWWLTGRNR